MATFIMFSSNRNPAFRSNQHDAIGRRYSGRLDARACTVPRMTAQPASDDDSQPSTPPSEPSSPASPEPPRQPVPEPTPEPSPEGEATELGLAVIAEATAVKLQDPAALDASSDNLRDTVDDLVDVPLTQRQEEVVESLASVSGALTAGLAARVAREGEKEPEAVLSEAALRLLAARDAE